MLDVACYITSYITQGRCGIGREIDMIKHTHESDKALKLRAYRGALFATLPDGVMLTDQEREQLYLMIEDNEADDERERMEDRCREW